MIDPLLVVHRHPFFQANIQAIGDSIDIVEIADGLRGNGDLMVVKAVRLKRFDVTCVNLTGGECQLDRIKAERIVCGAKSTFAKIKDKLVGSFGVFRLRTEVTSMGKGSVKAIIGIADDGGQHLFLRARQAVVLLHDAHVKLHGCRSRFGIIAHDLNDFRDVPGAMLCRFVKWSHIGGWRFGRDGFDKRHVLRAASRMI